MALLTPPPSCSRCTPLTCEKDAPAPTPLASAQTRRDSSTVTDEYYTKFASLASPSFQQEPDSAEHLVRLLRLAQCRRDRDRDRARHQGPGTAMADFGAQTPAPSNNLSCASVQDVQLNLRSVLDSKVTPKKAEHISVTLELRSTVRFTLVLSESENGVLENLNNIDPSLGGSRPTPVPTNDTGGQLSRVVDANETLMNQPHDNPALQRSVAKHIITAVSATDGSTWTVREVSRGAQGWTFTYLCNDSYQQWSRQSAKNPSKAVVGEYSQREPDPTLSGRPAFDCRGSVTIAFNRGSRSITIKYDHTPLHKTVAQLAEFFKPPPRQLGPGAQKAQQAKTPKKSKPEKRKRESTTRAQDENGNPKKRKKKKKNPEDEPGPAPQDGPIMPPDYPGAGSINGNTQAGPSHSNLSQPVGVEGQNPHTFNDYPQGLIGGGPPANLSSQNQLQQTRATSQAGPAVAVKVSPAEAARRKAVATSLLTNAGVDPSTLSADQFSIFSNQSPELQKESLSMLVKYGAERLQMVLPSNREASGSATTSTSATPAQSTQPTPSGPTTTKELVPQSGVSTTANGTSDLGADGAETQGTTKTPRKSKRPPGKSRTACFACKSRKVKCPKDRPTCAECQSSGLTCEYAPQKPKNKKKSDAIVVDDPDEDEDDAEETAQPDGPDEDVNEHQDIHDLSSYSQMPVSNMLTSSVEQTTQPSHPPQTDYFQSGAGLALPQSQISSSIANHHLGIDPGLALPSGQSYGLGFQEHSQPVDHQQGPAQAETVSPAQRKRKPAKSGIEARRSLPSGSARTDTTAAPPATSHSASDWTAISNVSMPSTNTTTAPPAASQSKTTRHKTRQASNSLSTDSAQTRYGMQQAAALSQAALYQPPHQINPNPLAESTRASNLSHTAVQQPHRSPTVVAAAQATHRTSPFQSGETPRTRPRQGQRTQTRTPVTDQSVTKGYRPPPDLGQQSSSTRTSHQPASGDVPNYSDYGRDSSTTTTSSRKAYDSHSQQQASSTTASSRPSESSGRNAAIAMSMSSQAPSTTAPAYPSNTSTSNQWSNSQSRNSSSYTNNNSSYNTQGPYSQAPSSSTTSTSLPTFNMRGSTTQQQPSRPEASFNQQSSYSAYSSQNTQQPNQAGNQQSNWHFNNSTSNSFTPVNQSSGYNYESWSGV